MRLFLKQDHSRDKWINRKSSVFKFLGEGFHISTSPKTGRLTSNMTELAKDLRKFITVNGEPLIEIDISSCNPFLLNYLISSIDNSYSDQSLQDTVNSQNTDKISKSLQNTDTCNRKTNQPKLPSIVGYFDLEEWKRLTTDDSTEDIYEVLRREWNGQLNKDYSRDDAKEILMDIFNGDETKVWYSGWVSNETNVFEDRFPNVMRVIQPNELPANFILTRQVASDY